MPLQVIEIPTPEPAFDRATSPGVRRNIPSKKIRFSRPKAHKPRIAIIRMSAKCSDLFSATFMDENEKFAGNYDGYVPDFFPGQHCGDYVELDIDLATGKILNWKRPTQEQIKKLLQS